jgi:hypothetical protein
MILLKDVSFERRARFLGETLSPFPTDAAFGEAIGGYDSDLADGLRACHELWAALYADTACVKGKDDEAKYSSLVATMDFLYAVFAFGAIPAGQHDAGIVVDKAALYEAYKKGSLTTRTQHLERHGLVVRYLAVDAEVRRLSQASQLSIACPDRPSLIAALRRFAAGVASYPDPGESVLYNKLGMFMKGDLETAILHTPRLRNALNPLEDDIVNALPSYRDAWMTLATRLRDDGDLDCTGFWTFGGAGAPAWGVSFAPQGQRPLTIFTLGSDTVFIEFTLPVDAAEAIIRARHQLSNTIREKIEGLHCVCCPKDCKGANLLSIDGITVCTGRAEGRRIYAPLTSLADFKSIHTMLSIIYQARIAGGEHGEA